MKKQARLTLLSLLLLGSSAVQAANEADLSGVALIKKGEQIAIASDCQACHTKPEGGTPFAGGYGISSPMGVIYATNITPSNTEGIGSYSEQQFAHAVRDGIRGDGTHLYPAMP